MNAFKAPDFDDRRRNAATAKKAELEKFRAKSEVDETVIAQRETARHEIAAAREARVQKRKASEADKQARAAVEKAAQEAASRAEEQACELAAAAEAERGLALEAERKKARDARYAARKMRK